MTATAQRRSYLYLVTGPGGKRYVGITSKGVRQRWAQHVREARRTLWKSALHDAIRKHGAEAFQVEQLSAHDSWAQACNAERVGIARLDTFGPNGYNLTLGGDGRLGIRHTDEFKEALSKRTKGVSRDLSFGEKMRVAHRNRPQAERDELARKISTANARRSPEEVARINEAIAASKRGKPRPADVVAKMKAARWPHLYGVAS